MDYDQIDYFVELGKKKSLTPSEMLAYLNHQIAIGEESLGEHEAQYRSECAMFGDAGPGQGSFIYRLKEDLAWLKFKRDQVQRLVRAQEK